MTSISKCWLLMRNSNIKSLLQFSHQLPKAGSAPRLSVSKLIIYPRHFSTSQSLLLVRKPVKKPFQIFGVDLHYLVWPTHFFKALLRKVYKPNKKPEEIEAIARRLSFLYVALAWTALGLFLFYQSKIEGQEQKASWWNPTAEYYNTHMTDLSQVDPETRKIFVFKDGKFQEDLEEKARLVERVRRLREEAQKSEDPTERRKWRLQPTEYMQKKMEEFHAASDEEKKVLLEELQKSNELR
eukprot:TRINITY_DN7771_c0_g1_i2.p1 TRINITY_DN7771_c0_g1~~TRINITY_DN7771_c0_g1_i2.p1  ORF type:complete len:240 (-),score=32.22 TRINITY_DN7771_c0_g1_i2:83-802(-)